MDNISENTKKILYVFPYWNTFIKDDFTIIEDLAYPLRFGNRHNILIPFYLLRQLILILLRLRTTTRILIQFGGYHSLIPVLLGYLFRKEIYIIVHGTDACSFKEINYGILRKKLLRAFCALSYRYCTKILPVSQSLIHTQNTYFKKEETYTFGLLHEFPTLDKHKFVVVHNGLKTEKWAFHKRAPNKTFISVAGGQSLGHLRKGIDLIINNAQHLADCKFIIVGIKGIDAAEAEGNITFLPKTTQAELHALFNESTYYLQLSIFEGFGLALCEAMLCGCIPIVSNVNMMPEIIGDSGYTLMQRDDKAYIDLIKAVVTEEHGSMELRQIRAAQRIKDYYPFEKRRVALRQLLI